MVRYAGGRYPAYGNYVGNGDVVSEGDGDSNNQKSNHIEEVIPSNNDHR